MESKKEPTIETNHARQTNQETSIGVSRIVNSCVTYRQNYLVI